MSEKAQALENTCEQIDTWMAESGEKKPTSDAKREMRGAEIPLGALSRFLDPKAIKSNAGLARLIAQRCIDTVEKRAMANFLLGEDGGVRLLADLLSKEPWLVLHEVAKLPGRGAVSRPMRSAAKAESVEQAGTTGATVSHDALASKVIAFLTAHPEATKPEIITGVGFDTPWAYKKVVGALVKAGKVELSNMGSNGKYSLRADSQDIEENTQETSRRRSLRLAATLTPSGLRAALKRHHGNVAALAKEIGVHTSCIYRRAQKHKVRLG